MCGFVTNWYPRDRSMLAELLATCVRCGVPPLATISNYMPRAAQSNRTLLHHIAWYSWKVVVTAGFAMLRKHCQYWLNNRMQNNQYHSNQILDRMDKWKICRFSGYFGFRSPLVVDLDFANGFFACWHGTHHALANQFHQWVEPWCVSSPKWCKWTVAWQPGRSRGGVQNIDPHKSYKHIRWCCS